MEVVAVAIFTLEELLKNLYRRERQLRVRREGGGGRGREGGGGRRGEREGRRERAQ